MIAPGHSSNACTNNGSELRDTFGDSFFMYIHSCTTNEAKKLTSLAPFSFLLQDSV